MENYKNWFDDSFPKKKVHEKKCDFTKENFKDSDGCVAYNDLSFFSISNQVESAIINVWQIKYKF